MVLSIMMIIDDDDDDNNDNNNNNNYRKLTFPRLTLCFVEAFDLSVFLLG